MNSEWKECKLSDVCTIRRGSSPRPIKDYFSDSGMPWVKISDATESNSRFIDRTNQYIKKEGVSRSVIVNKGDLILSNSGTAGLPKFMNITACIHDGWQVFKDLKDIEVLYLYYSLIFYRSKLLHGAYDSTMKNLTLDMVRDLPIKLPQLPEQKKIAEILSSLDDKIELNNKMNKNLEEIAQTIFKQWFVDFEFPDENGNPYKSSGGKMIQSELGEIPDGWEVGVLGDVINLSGDSTKPGHHLDNLPYVPIDIIPRKKMALAEFKSSNEANSSLVLFKENDILFGAMRSYFHKVVISPFEGVTRQTCFIFRPKKEYDLSFSLLTLFQESTVDFSHQNSKGSTMPYAVWNNGMDKIKIVLPTVEYRRMFNLKLMGMIDKMKRSIFENQSLTKTRDELLPKLMSGEIRV